MRKFIGAVAIFCGWLSMPIGAMAGFMVSQFFGINHVGGPLPPTTVYGIPGIVVLGVFAVAAVATALPLSLATLAPDPQRPLHLMAVVMVMTGAAMLASELGRAFGLPLMAGAASLWFGGDVVHQEALAAGSVERETKADARGSEVVAAPTDPAAIGQAATAEAVGLASAAATPSTANSTETPADSVGGVASTLPEAAAADAPAVETATADRTHAPGAAEGRRRGTRRRKAPSERACPWCSTGVPAGDAACPNCGATLDAPAADEVPIPGLTEVPPSLREYAQAARRGKKRPSLLKMIFSDSPIPTAIDAPPPSDADALRPPSAELRAEMARLDAEIAAGLEPLSGEGATSDEIAADPEPSEP